MIRQVACAAVAAALSLSSQVASVRAQTASPVPPAAVSSAPLSQSATVGTLPAADPNVTPTPRSTPLEPNYQLDTGDTIAVRVARHNDVTGTFLIAADGLLTLPRMREPIQTRGRTCAELASMLRASLSHELKLRPNQIVVTVVAPRVRRIFVRGTATRGGDFDMKNGWRVSELVAVVGGVPQADRVRAQIFNPRRPAKVNIKLTDALEKPDASPENAVLMEGDTLTLDLPNNKRLFVEGEAPRGKHELDERFGLRRALSQIGFTTTNATGSLRTARLVRSKIPGDESSEKITTTVDLFELMTNEDAPDIPLQDNDTLVVPRSTRWIYVMGEVTGGPRQWFMPEERKTFLLDVMTTSGFTTTNARIGKIQVGRPKQLNVPNPDYDIKTYDYGKFLRNGEAKDNPEILPQDVILIPNVKRPDIGGMWTLFGLRNLLKTFVPFVP